MGERYAGVSGRTVYSKYVLLWHRVSQVEHRVCAAEPSEITVLSVGADCRSRVYRWGGRRWPGLCANNVAELCIHLNGRRTKHGALFHPYRASSKHERWNQAAIKRGEVGGFYHMPWRRACYDVETDFPIHDSV